MRRFVAVAVIFAACAKSVPPPQAIAEGRTVYVTASALNVRTGPSAGAEVIGRVRRAEPLFVLENRDGWLRVRLHDGSNGWVAAQYVATTEPRRHPGCADDAGYRFTQPPVPSFTENEAHGIVTVEASVDQNGDVTSTRVVANNTGDESLGAVAEREIRGAKFVPPIRNCAPRPFVFTYKRTF